MHKFSRLQKCDNSFEQDHMKFKRCVGAKNGLHYLDALHQGFGKVWSSGYFKLQAVKLDLDDATCQMVSSKKVDRMLWLHSVHTLCSPFSLFQGTVSVFVSLS